MQARHRIAVGRWVQRRCERRCERLGRPPSKRWLCGRCSPAAFLLVSGQVAWAQVVVSAIGAVLGGRCGAGWHPGSGPPALRTLVVVAAALEPLLGPRRRPFPLIPVSGDTFRYQPAGENAYGPSAVTFTVGADGRATAVRIDNLNRNGQGVLQRR